MSKKDFDDFKFAGSKKMALIKFHGDLLFCDPGWTTEYKNGGTMKIIVRYIK